MDMSDRSSTAGAVERVRFYDTFGSIPVANGSWPSGLKPKHGSRDDK